MFMVKVIKIVGILLIFAFTANTVLASTARHGLRSFSKINHKGKRSVSKKLIMDDPITNDDFKTTFHSVKHHSKRFYNSVSAITTTLLTLVSLDCINVVPRKISLLYSNNLSDIFIPPRSTF